MTEVVSVCEVVGLIVVAVVDVLEIDRDVTAGKCARERIGSFDIAIVLDTSVVGSLEVVEVDVGVHVVTLSEVVAVDDASKLAVLGVLVAAACVVVVELEAETCIFVDIGGKICVDAVLPGREIAYVAMVGYVGDGTLGVGEEKFVYAFGKVVEWGLEHELPVFFAVDIYARHAGGAC